MARGLARIVGLGCTALAAAFACPAARAQSIDQYLYPSIVGPGVLPGVTVLSRQRPEYDSPGVQVGSFVIRPNLSEAAGYDDNVTGTRPSHGSSLVQTDVNLGAASTWTRDTLGANLTLHDFRFFDQPRQSYTDWTAGANGSVDIGTDVVSLRAVHVNANQTPRDLNVPTLDHPIAYRVDSVQLNYHANFSRSALVPGLNVSSYNFDNGTVGGQPYVQTYRDRVVVTPSILASYDVAPLRSIVLSLRDSIASYFHRPPGTPLRDFNDVMMLAGVNYDTGGLVRLRLLGGYEIRSFSSAAYKTISAPVVETSAVWTPTGQTTVTGTVSRTIEDSASDTTVGYTETAAKLRIDHEYLPNVLLDALGGAYFDQYAEHGGHQAFYTAGVGTTWLLNRHMRLVARYDFSTRQSKATQNLNTFVAPGEFLGSTYSENRFLLQVRLGL